MAKKMIAVNESDERNKAEFKRRSAQQDANDAWRRAIGADGPGSPFKYMTTEGEMCFLLEGFYDRESKNPKITLMSDEGPFCVLTHNHEDKIDFKPGEFFVRYDSYHLRGAKLAMESGRFEEVRLHDYGAIWRIKGGV